MTSTRPPRLAERLLAAALRDPAWREAVVGDLHEEFMHRRAATNTLRACAWYWCQAIRLTAHFDRRRRLDIPRIRQPRAGVGDTLMQDFRFALRMLIRRPGLTFAVVTALALGLGANSAVFSVVDALVLRPFPFADVDRMALIASTAPRRDSRQESVAAADFLDWREQADAFEYLAAADWWDASLGGPDLPERVQGFRVSATYFSIFGITPIAGRAFRAEDERPGAPRSLVMGHGLWKRRFGGDLSIVGTTVNVDREPYVVLGIAPPGFAVLQGAEIWAPLPLAGDDASNRQALYLTVLGRLRPDRTLDDASAQLSVIAARLGEQHPATNKSRGVRVYSLAAGLGDEGVGPFFAIWQASAFGLLLIACANVANLLLARGAERQRELALRVAVGASRTRVVRQLFIESLVLALAGAAGAVVLAHLGVRAIRNAMPASIARFVAGWDQIDVDGRSLLATLILTCSAAVLFGVLPALKASRPQVSETLREGGRGGTAGVARTRVRAVLAASQIALAIALLAASLLSIDAARRAIYGWQGYDPEGVLAASLVLPDGPYAEPDTRRRFARRVLDDLRAAPGVESVALINSLPSGSNNSTIEVHIEGQPERRDATPVADHRSISADYFSTMRIPLVRGRMLAEADKEDTPPVVVVSDSFAQRHWPGADPLGGRLRLGNSDEWATVVGVCGDVLHDWFNQRRAPTVYRPFAQAPRFNHVFVARTSGDPAALSPAVRAAVRNADAYQPISEMRTMRKVIVDRAVGLRYAAWLMTIMGGLALVLAALGVYSVMTYIASRRTQEIGVRIALGATRADVIRLTVGQVARVTIAGVFIGVGLAAAIGRVMQGVLFGAVSLDPVLVVLPAVTLSLVALLAGYVPARRAAGIDPIAALRAD